MAIYTLKKTREVAEFLRTALKTPSSNSMFVYGGTQITATSAKICFKYNSTNIVFSDQISNPTVGVKVEGELIKIMEAERILDDLFPNSRLQQVA